MHVGNLCQNVFFHLYTPTLSVKLRFDNLCRRGIKDGIEFLDRKHSAFSRRLDKGHHASGTIRQQETLFRFCIDQKRFSSWVFRRNHIVAPAIYHNLCGSI